MADAQKNRTQATINLNDHVWVQLDPRGLAEIAKDPDQVVLHRYRREIDGWTEWTLWELMNTLGHLCFMGPPPPFKTTIRLSMEDIDG